MVLTCFLNLTQKQTDTDLSSPARRNAYYYSKKEVPVSIEKTESTGMEDNFLIKSNDHKYNEIRKKIISGFEIGRKECPLINLKLLDFRFYGCYNGPVR